MGFFEFCLGGAGFFIIGSWQASIAATTHLFPPPPPSPNIPTTKPKSLFNSIDLLAITIFSLLHIINSTISSFKGIQINDQIGVALQLQVSAVSSLFLVYSIVSLLKYHTNLLPIPPSILNLIALFAFGQEFLLFYLQKKDPNGIENRYYSLLLVPITVCICSTLLDMGYPRSCFPGLARGVGLILQGTWFVQMGFSFFTKFMTDGCALYEKSSGNYTIKCKKHVDYHRSKAIATLQFNLHLAFLVVFLVGLYAIICRNSPRMDYSNYKPLHVGDQSEELRQFSGLHDGNQTQFTLDSDEEESAENGDKKSVSVSEVNGFANH